MHGHGTIITLCAEAYMAKPQCYLGSHMCAVSSLGLFKGDQPLSQVVIFIPSCSQPLVHA